MDDISPGIRSLARHLIALESEQSGAAIEARQVCEKLREPLAQLMGEAGYYSLMSRALAIAKTEQPSLAAVRILPGGTLEGLENSGQEAVVAIKSQLLGLLVVFIGEPLVMGLVRETWPEARTNELEGDKGGSP